MSDHERHPWDEDAEGYDAARRHAEARQQEALAELKAHIVAVVDKARDELLQIAREQSAVIADLEARLARLEAHHKRVDGQ